MENLKLNYAQIVATTGLASRRDLRKRRVRLTDPEGNALNARAKVEITDEAQEFYVDNVRVSFWQELDSVWLMNKPRGYVVSRSMDDGEPVFAILPLGAPHETLEPIGRLDADTSGVLIFTEDGQLNQRMRHASLRVDRTYLAGVDAPVDPRAIEEVLNGELQLRNGDIPEVHGFDDVSDGAGPSEFSWLREACPEWMYEAGENRYLLTLSEGKYHEVRRVFAALGVHVEQLRRVRYGPIWVFGEAADRALIEKNLHARDESGVTLDAGEGIRQNHAYTGVNIPVYLDEGESLQLPQDLTEALYAGFGLERTGGKLRTRFLEEM